MSEDKCLFVSWTIHQEKGKLKWSGVKLCHSAIWEIIRFEICNNSNPVTTISVRTRSNPRKVRTHSLHLSFRKAFYPFISLGICEEHECMHITLWENNTFHNSLKVNCKHPSLSSVLMGPSWTLKVLGSFYCLLINFEVNICKFCITVCEEEGIKKSIKIAVWL